MHYSVQTLIPLYAGMGVTVALQLARLCISPCLHLSAFCRLSHISYSLLTLFFSCLMNKTALWTVLQLSKYSSVSCNAPLAPLPFLTLWATVTQQNMLELQLKINQSKINCFFFFARQSLRDLNAWIEDKPKQILLTISWTAGTPEIPLFALGSGWGTRENARVRRAVLRAHTRGRTTRAHSHCGAEQGKELNIPQPTSLLLPRAWIWY